MKENDVIVYQEVEVMGPRLGVIKSFTLDGVELKTDKILKYSEVLGVVQLITDIYANEIEEQVKFIRNSFGAHVKSIRLKQGITIKQLAKRTNMNTTHISHIENGDRLPNIDNLVRLSIGLRCGTQHLLNSKTYDTEFDLKRDIKYR